MTFSHFFPLSTTLSRLFSILSLLTNAPQQGFCRFERLAAVAGAEWKRCDLAGKLRQVIRDRYSRKCPELFSAHKA
jgi:hypothetical protein